MLLKVSVEINGVQNPVGIIDGETSADAVFSYSEKYLSREDARQISISMPLQKESFSPMATRAFFEGLLPEGFTRHTLAGWLNVDESNYIQLLKNLGSECLGAIKITDEEKEQTCSYEKLSKDDMLLLAKDGILKTAEYAAESRLSLAGATGKTGLMLSNGEWYLPKGSAPSTHIVKQSHVRFNDIVANELLCQKTAEKLGISVPKCFAIKPGDDNSQFILFASERYDRQVTEKSETIKGVKIPFRLHQEDFAQAMGLASSEKYEADKSKQYLKRMFEIIRSNSQNPLEDQLLLWDRIIFNYLIGNADFHIKNTSLLYSPDLKTVRLAPCYDTVCTKIYDAATRNMAFSIAGKYKLTEVGKEDFAKAALECGLGNAVAMKHYDEMQNNFEDALKSAASELKESGIETEKLLGEILQS